MWTAKQTGDYIFVKAKHYCDDLTLCGYSDWDLPDIGELRSLIRGCPNTALGSDSCNVQPGGCLDKSCNEGDLCVHCPDDDGPAGGCYWPDEMEGDCVWPWWTSSFVENHPSSVWSVRFSSGTVYEVGATAAGNKYQIRCVR